MVLASLPGFRKPLTSQFGLFSPLTFFALLPPDLLYFMKGVAVGLAIAAPVGPVAILCIRRTLLGGRLAGFASGLGAVTADVMFGSAASYGVAALSSFLLAYETWLRGFGGAIMLLMGAKTWFGRAAEKGDGETNRFWPAYWSALILTVTNPITIFAFTSIFAAFGIVSKDMPRLDTLTLISGVALGCLLWWGGLTLISSAFRNHVGASSNRWLYHLSGGLLIFFGLLSLGSLVIS